MRGVALGLETASRPVRRSASRLLSPPLAPGTKARLRETRNDTKRTAAILLARKSAKRRAAELVRGWRCAAKEGRCQIPALSSSIPDFCFPDPEMGFEPIKSMVSRGLSPNEAEWGRKRSLKLVTQSPCHALPNFATIQASTRQVRPKRRGAPARRLGLLHF